MSRTAVIAALAAALLPWAVAVHAQGAAGEGPPWFTVEVVVFAHRGQAGLTEEIWPADPGRPDTSEAVALTPDGMPLLDAPAGAPPVFLPAGRSERQLYGIVRALERSGAYEPLLHMAWRQAGLGKSRALPVRVRAGATGDDLAPPTLEGTLRVYLSRYLHLEADLVYAREVPATVPVAAAAEPAVAAGTPAFEVALFRLNQSRRMRSDEIHYIDHPIFGIIAQIRRYTFPEPEPEPAPEEPAPAGTTAGAGTGADGGPR